MYMYMILPTQILITNYVRDSYCRWIWPGWLIRLMREELMHAFCQVYRSLLWILDDEHIYKEESSPCLCTHVSFLGCCVFLSYNSTHHHPWQKSLRLHQPKITRDCVFMNSLYYVTIPSIVFDDFFSILIIMRLRHNQKRKKHLAPHSLKFPRRFTLNRSAEGRNSKYDSRVLQKIIEGTCLRWHMYWRISTAAEWNHRWSLELTRYSNGFKYLVVFGSWYTYLRSIRLFSLMNPLVRWEHDYLICRPNKQCFY